MKTKNRVEFELKHGIRLAVIGEPGDGLIHYVSQFLADAMRHFKHYRDVLKETRYPRGGYQLAYKIGRRGSLIFEMWHPAESPPVADWVSAVISGYTDANTLEQIAEELDSYRAASAEGGWIAEIVAALDRPGSEVEALRLMLNRQPPAEG